MKTFRVKDTEKFVTTPDARYFQADATGKVKVRMVESIGRFITISVWGDDDIGMAKEFMKVDRQDAKKLYDSITDGITKAKLKALGFEQC